MSYVIRDAYICMYIGDVGDAGTLVQFFRADAAGLECAARPPRNLHPCFSPTLAKYLLSIIRGAGDST